MTTFLLLLTCLAFGEVSDAKAPAKATPQANLSDAQLEQDIKARFAKSKIAANNFQVKVSKGVATIDGKANIIQHKGAATRMARSAGARQVVNRIQITEAARQKAAGQLSPRKASVKVP